MLDDNNNFGQLCVYSFRADQLIHCDDSISEPASIGSMRGLAGGNAAAPQDTSTEANTTVTTVTG